MALTLPELQAMRDALLKARASGTRRVRTGDEEIEYKSDSEMDRALRNLDSQIASLQSGSTPNTFKFSTSKGLE